MSWWDIGGGGDDVLGDRPADLMSDALDTIAQERAQHRRPKPTLQELLDGFTAALRSMEGSIQDGEQVDRRHITVLLESAPATVSTAATPTIDERIVATFREAIAKIVAEYEKRWDRKPRLRELLKTLHFILGAHLQEFLSDASEKMRITAIVAE